MCITTMSLRATGLHTQYASLLICQGRSYTAVCNRCQSQRDLGKKFRLTGLLVCRRAELARAKSSTRSSSLLTATLRWLDSCPHAQMRQPLNLRNCFTARSNSNSVRPQASFRIKTHYLRAYTSHEQASWARLLPTAEYAYNNSRNTSTEMSPFRAMYGYDPKIRFDVADDVPEEEIPAARDRIRHLQKLREELRKKLTTAQER